MRNIERYSKTLNKIYQLLSDAEYAIFELEQDIRYNEDGDLPQVVNDAYRNISNDLTALAKFLGRERD